MLTELEISNFAIIDELSVSFGPGLNVITGESGVGKSVILQAIELMLGSRPKKQLLREGADSWEVQALFDLSSMPKKALADLPDIAQVEELSVARSMNSAGKGRVHINGRLSSAAMLEEVASRLINICGQTNIFVCLTLSITVN
jgi:DNA repair protein RecN (Recombination protein N)